MSNDRSLIQYGELVKKLVDPSSDLEHYLGYLVEVTRPGQMAPELAPNPTKVRDIPATVEGGVGLGFANWFMRQRRHGDYRQKIHNGWQGPKIVSEGDSWFQYPTTLRDVIDHLMVDHAILSLGAAGDKLSDIENQREIVKRIKAEKASALLLSAGGNDLFDRGNLGRLMESPESGASAEDYLGSTFSSFMHELMGQFQNLFRRVHRAHPNVHILIHGYCPAFPRGGVWIEKPLTERGIPRELQHDIVKLILKEFNKRLSVIAASPEFNGMLEHIDVTHLGVNASDWHNEIHLNSENYLKVAELFRQSLNRRLAAVETASVPNATTPQIEAAVRDAHRLSVFDESTLLRELNLRVELSELDATFQNEVDPRPLVLGQPQPEIGVDSLLKTTRRIIRYWEYEIRELICGGSIDSALGKEILKHIEGSKKLLSGAIAAWIAGSPLGVPTALASALGAWLAAKVIESGHELLCQSWVPEKPRMPNIAMGVSEGGNAATVGNVRDRFTMPDGSEFTENSRLEMMDRLNEKLQKNVVENPRVPVDADAASRFMSSADIILRRLGSESETFELNDEEFGQAEGMILLDGTRPALYVRDGFIDTSDSTLDDRWRDRILPQEQAIRQLIASSGRIIRGSDRSADNVYGSAWMIEGGRIATARHVFEAMTFLSNGKRRLNDVYYVDFSVEADRPTDPQSVFRIAGVDWVSADEINLTVNPEQLDAVTFNLIPESGRPFPHALPLASIDETESFAGGSWILNVGHPGEPRGSWLVGAEDNNDRTVSRAVLHELIGNKFGVKRFSPGKITVARGIVEGDDDTQHVFAHDATTLGGSSGSAIISLSDQGPVIGLHFAGWFGTRNFAHLVPAISDNWERGTST